MGNFHKLGLVVFAAALLAGPGASALRAEEELVDIVDRVKTSVFTVLVYYRADGKEPDASGTGWVYRNGMVVTNHHVVAKAKKVLLRAPNGLSIISTGIYGSDRDNDLALIAVDFGRGGPRELPLSTAKPRIGEKCFVIGSPLGLEQTITDGIVSSLREHDGLSVIQVTAAISPGSSGSPVFTKDGKVIGVATFSRRGGQSLNFAIPVDAIGKVKLSAAPVEWTKWSIASPPPPPEPEPAILPRPQAAPSGLELVFDGFHQRYLDEQTRQKATRPIFDLAQDRRAIGHLAGPYKIAVLLNPSSAVVTSGDVAVKVEGVNLLNHARGQTLNFAEDLVFVAGPANLRYGPTGGPSKLLPTLVALNSAEFRAAKERYERKAALEKQRRAVENGPQIKEISAKLAAVNEEIRVLNLDLEALVKEVKEEDAKAKRRGEIDREIKMYEVTRDSEPIARKIVALEKERKGLPSMGQAAYDEKRKRIAEMQSKIAPLKANAEKLAAELRTLE